MELIPAIMCGLCCFGLLLTVILIPVSIRNVSNTEVAIRYDGLTKEVYSEPITEGKYLHTPATELIYFNSKVMRENFHFTCLSKDTVRIEMNIDIEFQFGMLEGGQMKAVKQIFGDFASEGYFIEYLRVAATDSFWDVCSTYKAKSWYTERANVQRALDDQLVIDFQENAPEVQILSVILRNYEFPQEYETAVNQKQQAEQRINLILNERQGKVVKAVEKYDLAVLTAKKIAIEAAGEVESITAQKEAQIKSIEAFWNNRIDKYVKIKQSMGLSAEDFVYQYLASLVLEKSDAPVTDLADGPDEGSGAWDGGR